MKNNPVFSDLPQKEGKKVPDFLQNPSNNEPEPKPQTELTLSREEYRDVVKKAYKEGLKNAAKEAAKEKDVDKEEKTPQVPVQKTYVDKRKDDEAAAKSQGKQESETRQKVDAIIAHQNIELLRTSTLFPFNFFPDTIIIDTNKLTVIKKQFFASEYITTIPLKDLSDVTVQTALFMGSISIEYMPQASSPGAMNSVKILLTSLKRADAIRIQTLLKGALVAKAEGIDISKLPPDEVESIIEKFGSSDGVN